MAGLKDERGGKEKKTKKEQEKYMNWVKDETGKSKIKQEEVNANRQGMDTNAENMIYSVKR